MENVVNNTLGFLKLFLSTIFQGKIACANVLSDLYAMGVEHCDNVLMLLGVSEKLTNKERSVVTPLVIQGFNGESD